MLPPEGLRTLPLLQVGGAFAAGGGRPVPHLSDVATGQTSKVTARVGTYIRKISRAAKRGRALPILVSAVAVLRRLDPALVTPGAISGRLRLSSRTTSCQLHLAGIDRRSQVTYTRCNHTYIGVSMRAERSLVKVDRRRLSILVALAKDGPLRFTELQDHLHLKPTQLNRALKPLVEGHLVVLETVPGTYPVPLKYALSPSGTRELDRIRHWAAELARDHAPTAQAQARLLREALAG